MLKPKLFDVGVVVGVHVLHVRLVTGAHRNSVGSAPRYS